MLILKISPGETHSLCCGFSEPGVSSSSSSMYGKLIVELTTLHCKKIVVKKLSIKPRTRETDNQNGKRKRKNKKIKIVTWNTLSLYRANACQNLTEMLSQYTVSITALDGQAKDR
jgi:hypothetical protein